MENYNCIESLEGEELNIVSFVMDYVELHFNGPIIRALTDPIVKTPNGEYQFPKSGSRDALCKFIGKKVESIIFRDNVSLTLVFLENEKIIIPLDGNSLTGPEAMHWCPVGGPMQVWQ